MILRKNGFEEMRIKTANNLFFCLKIMVLER